jgi:hypothetical protein
MIKAGMDMTKNGSDEVDADNMGQMTNEIELDPKIQAALGRAIQAHYDDMITAAIPDRFLALLAELEAKEQRHEH